jgi:hypothetical protein
MRYGLMLLAGSLLGTTGCFTAVKQVYYEARGAKADIRFGVEPPLSALKSAQSVKFLPVHSTLPERLCSPSLLRTYDNEAHQTEDELKASYPGGSPQVAVDCEFLYGQSKGLLSGGLLLTRVKFQSDGSVIGDAVVRAESKSFREGGESALMRAALKAVRDFLEEPKKPPKENNE